MQSQQLNRQTRQKQSSLKTSFLIKIHISPHEQTQLLLSRNSNIDEVIEKCITKYKLKKEAHTFLKKQILTYMHKILPNQRCKTDYSSGQKQKKIIELNQCVSNPLIKKQTILKDLKIGDIDKNRISVQRTPKSGEFGLQKKESFHKKQKNNSSTTCINFTNQKTPTLKKKQSSKQNIQIMPVLFKNFSHQNTNKSKPKQLGESEKFVKKQEKPRQTLKKQLKQKKEKIETQNSFLELLESQQSVVEGIKGRRIKTESSHQVNDHYRMMNEVEEGDNEKQMDMKQFSLIDLQKQMNEQMVDLKYQKQIRRLQPQLCNLFHSIIRYNPPKINRIDPRYACFEDLSEKVIKALHQFLIQLKDHELNSLDFENFKTLIIKYRSDFLLNSLK